MGMSIRVIVGDGVIQVVLLFAYLRSRTGELSSMLALSSEA